MGDLLETVHPGQGIDRKEELPPGARADGERSPVAVDRSPHYLEGLSPEQRAAVLEVHPRALVLAGAGSGKTRVLVACMTHLLQTERIPPRRLLAFSFTRKACAEIQVRLAALLQQGGAPPPPTLAFTFNGFAYRLVLRHHRLLGFPGPPEVLSESGPTTPIEAFRRFLADHEIPHGGESPFTLFRRMRPGPRELPDPTVSGLEASFLAWKRSRGLLELSDQVPLAVELLEGPIGTAVRGGLDAVLVDEFQDIDPVQQRLFETLLGPTTRFMVFGDDDQAIYRWRGSDPGSIRAYHQLPEVKIHLLTTNYRCRAPILALAAAVVSGDPGRIDKPARSHRRGGPRPTCLTGRHQSAQVVQTIRALSSRGRRLEEIAVLVRDHAHSHDIQRALIRAELPVTGELEGPGVRVLTYHASKGLEFPVVLLPFLDRGHFPDTRRLARERATLRRRLRDARRSTREIARIDARLSVLEGTDRGLPGSWPDRARALLTRIWERLLGHGDIDKRRRALLARRRERETCLAWLPTLEEAWRSVDEEHVAAIAEERRLCYVAMTRAQDELWMFCGLRVRRSEFLCGIPKERIVWTA